MSRAPTCSTMIFDLDGTLIDSLADIADATNNTLAAFGMPVHPVDAYRHFVGNGVQVLLERALPKDHAGPLPDRFVESFKQLYRRHLNVKTRPYGGIDEVLRRLTDKGITLAILSNKPDEFTKVCVSQFFSDIAFSVIYGLRDGVPRKPDPRSALEIAAVVGALPEQCAFVGDSSVDMATGRAAGMCCIGVSWGFREPSELVAAGADLVIDHPHELLDYVHLC
ncbi:HAD family hydrolase [Desulfofustis glycolicus]|nr:HAD-IA family hydrolase [Desulfofustis glycolicus]